MKPHDDLADATWDFEFVPHLAKLKRPATAEPLIERPRLDAMLHAARARRVTVIVARGRLREIDVARLLGG